jgi:hypothetical protein
MIGEPLAWGNGIAIPSARKPKVFWQSSSPTWTQPAVIKNWSLIPGRLNPPLQVAGAVESGLPALGGGLIVGASVFSRAFAVAGGRAFLVSGFILVLSPDDGARAIKPSVNVRAPVANNFRSDTQKRQSFAIPPKSECSWLDGEQGGGLQVGEKVAGIDVGRRANFGDAMRHATKMTRYAGCSI